METARKYRYNNQSLDIGQHAFNRKFSLLASSSQKANRNINESLNPQQPQRGTGNMHILDKPIEGAALEYHEKAVLENTRKYNRV